MHEALVVRPVHRHWWSANCCESAWYLEHIQLFNPIDPNPSILLNLLDVGDVSWFSVPF